MPAALSLYIARRLLLAIGVAFAIMFTLIFLIDFVDLIQDVGRDRSAGLAAMVLVGLQRTPIIAEAVFPFMVLFGAIGAFTSLSRRMELVVARASGVSVWQILAPALLAAAILGIFVTAAYNPLATYLNERSIGREAGSSASPSRKESQAAHWIRQRSVENQSIIRATNSMKRGSTLTGVTAFVFTPEGAFDERIDAAKAVLQPGSWELHDARVVRQGAPAESHGIYHLSTNLTADQVAETIAAPESISFWALPAVIAQWQQTGIQTEKFRLHYQRLIARPALFASMVLIAAAVSLGFTRLGGVSRAILSGVVAGFVLYVGGEMAGDLGAAGFITPAVAAWAPPIIGVLLSVTVLLHQEDG